MATKSSITSTFQTDQFKVTYAANKPTAGDLTIAIFYTQLKKTGIKLILNNAEAKQFGKDILFYAGVPKDVLAKIT